MKKFRTIIMVVLICTAILALSVQADEDAKVYTFIPQEIQPNEKSAVKLPFDKAFEQNDNKVNDSIQNFNGDVSYVLDSLEITEILEGQNLIDAMKYDENSTEAVYSDSSVSLKSTDGQPIHMNIEDISSYMSNGDKNYAVLYKIKPNSKLDEYQISLVGDSMCVDLFIRNQTVLEVGISAGGKWYQPNDDGENIHQLSYVQDEWYYIFIALDSEFNYRFLMWQEGNVSNIISNNYALRDDIDDTYKENFNNVKLVHMIMPVQGEESVCIESISVLKYNAIKDAVDIEEIVNENVEYTYSNDYEKYQLAVDLFNAEDYYNAYLLLNELNGYSTSGSYLAECERLLQTIDIKYSEIADAVAYDLQEQNIKVHDYLYTYQAEKIRKLDLSFCDFDDWSFLNNFPNLKELHLENCRISDLTFIKDMYSLERLSLANNNISDLKPLYNLTNLEYLNLYHNIVEDVSPLSNLKSLKELNLSTNNIYTIDGLYGNENLEKVDLSYNFICSVNALNGSDIKELNILNTNIKSLSAVACFSNLESLTAGYKLGHPMLAGCPMDQLSYNAKYSIGGIWDESLTGLEYIQGFEKLKYLELARLELGYEEDELLPLTTLPNLEVLKFYRYNGPSGVEILGKLTSLTELTLDTWMYGFGDLSFLPKLTNLKKFEGPAVETLSLITQIENLEELRMNGHIEHSVDWIGELKNLKLLKMSSEPTVDILDFSFLIELENLEYFQVAMQNPPWDRGRTGFTPKNIEKVFEVESLKYINISLWQKNLKSIEGIQNLTNLEYLHLDFDTCSDERITDQTLYTNLDSLKLSVISIANGKNKYISYMPISEVYDMWYEPDIGDLSYPFLNEFDINEGNKDGYFNEERYYYSQNLLVKIVEDCTDAYGGGVTLKVPEGVRNLFIENNSQCEVKLNIDASECVGLEWLVIYDEYHTEGLNGLDSGNLVIENLDGLADCVNLRIICINGAEINDISGLENCDKLETVHLMNNNITDISALADKKYLRIVKLKGNSINNWDALDNCLRLESK